MRKVLVSLTLAACLLFAANAEAAETRIVFFNMGEVAEKSDAYKIKLDQLKKEFETEGKKLQSEAEAWQKKVNDFQVQQQALSPTAREDRQAALATEKNNLDAKMNSYGRKRQTAEKDAEQLIQRIIFYAATEVAKRENFSALIEQNLGGAILVDPKLDVSDLILKEANKVWKDKPKAVFGQ